MGGLSDNGEAPRARWPSYWLIVEHETSNMEVLAVDLDGGGKALAIFSFEEEAELFLHHELSGTGWQVRETTIGELVSVLYGFCADTGKVVVLDPLPRDVCEGTNGLLSLRRSDFVQTLIDRRGVPVATLGQSSPPAPRGPFPGRPGGENR